jgi:hypothetical protein
VWLPDLPGVVSAAQLAGTVDHLLGLQLPSGMIQWFPGGHADPWNHCEAVMALAVGGQREAAERGLDWLVGQQRDDGAWHQYYLADAVEQDKLDANCVAYVAAAAWHHWLLYRDRGFLETIWPVVERALDFVLALQTPRGEILWARHADGTPWSFALLTGSSSICHSLRCGIATANELGHDRPDWELSAAALAHTIRHVPEAFAPKHRWAMDWYYPVLTGVVGGSAGRERLATRWDAFVMEGRGVRCVVDRPWVTVAETCEMVMALLAVGEDDRAAQLFHWVQSQREPEGGYWTGIVYPDEVHFPGGEQSSYTAAAVILAADALAQSSPAAGLFVQHDDLPALIDPPTDGVVADAEQVGE